MSNHDAYALLIGIDDYSTFDLSRDAPIGTSDLPGSRNDARTFYRLCRLLGMKPENIRVLASPPIDFQELEGASPETVAPATEQEILEKLGWLAGKLADPSRPTGLLTYSGHGEVTPKQGLALCPSDVRGDGDPALDHAIPFSKINEILAHHKVGENLTVVLDTCHSGGLASAAEARAKRCHKTGRVKSLRNRVVGAINAQLTQGHAAPPLEEINARVLAASGRDQVAYQSIFDGRFRGVFSWAVSCAMEQWQVVEEDGWVRLDVGYGRLVETVRGLIAALHFDQTPELRGPMGLADLAFLHHGLTAHPGETAEMPSGGFKTEQVDPGFKDYLIYEIKDPTGILKGKVLVTNTAGGGYEANREYWYMSANLSNSGTYTFTGGSSQYWSTPPSGLGTLSFKTVRTPTWSSGTPSGTMLFSNNLFTGERIAINWQMSLSHGSWIGSITWWHSSTANLFGPGTSTTLASGTPTGSPWYSFTATPL